LKAQKEEDRNKKSVTIKKELFRLAVFKRAKRVMFYISFDGEVNTQEMIKEAIELGKAIAVPACGRGRKIKPCRLSRGMRLTKGPYGVSEPAVKKPVNLEDLDLVIVPGVAFDKKGNRLGRGKGCYDYFLRKLPEKTPTVGLAFAFQILPHLPTTSDDVSVEKILFA
jgi:5-formyltetrahydrofolate cyclo-ligase